MTCITSLAAPRVLVVDDERDTATSLARVLKTAGFEVAMTHDGEAALAQAERFQPDVCVVDINMPRMNGYELARKLRQLLRGRRVVLATVTGFDDGDHLDRAAAAGFDLHFSKPANPVELIDQLYDCVRHGCATTSPGAR